MAVLDKAARDKMPSSEFGQPKTHGYPMNDETHARLAISGASRAEHVGNISPAEKTRIQTMAREKLAHWGKGAGGKSDPPKGSSGGGMMDHKAEVAKMDPMHVHRVMTEAAAGIHGPAAMEGAHHAMQPMMQQGNQDGQMEEQAPRRSPFSDGDMDDSGSGGGMQQQGAPMSRSSMFGMGGGE